MKKIFLTTLFLCTIFCSFPIILRSKGTAYSPGASRKGYFKMKLDGVQKRYDTCYSSNFHQEASANQIYYQVNIFGGRPGDYCGISANDLSPVKEGTYTSKINPVTRLPMAGLGAYKEPGSKDIYISYRAGWPIYDITITLTEFTPDHIKGTFYGKLRLVGGSKVIDVTGGEFETNSN